MRNALVRHYPYFGTTDCAGGTDIKRARAVLMAEGQILFDAVSVGWVNELGLFNAAAAFSVFGAQQVAPAGATEQYLAGAGDLETFGY